MSINKEQIAHDLAVQLIPQSYTPDEALKQYETLFAVFTEKLNQSVKPAEVKPGKHLHSLR